MFRITKESTDRYKIENFQYIREANFYSFVYSIANLLEEDLARALQGRIAETSGYNDARWAIDIVKLTNCAALIGDDGVLRAVPVPRQKELPDGKAETRLLQTPDYH